MKAPQEEWRGWQGRLSVLSRFCLRHHGLVFFQMLKLIIALFEMECKHAAGGKVVFDPAAVLAAGDGLAG